MEEVRGRGGRRKNYIILYQKANPESRHTSNIIQMVYIVLIYL